MGSHRVVELVLFWICQGCQQGSCDDLCVDVYLCEIIKLLGMPTTFLIANDVPIGIATTKSLSISLFHSISSPFPLVFFFFFVCFFALTQIINHLQSFEVKIMDDLLVVITFMNFIITNVVQLSFSTPSHIHFTNFHFKVPRII